MMWFFFALISAAAVTAESVIDKGLIKRQDPALFASILAILSGVVTLPFIWIVPWSSMSAGLWVWLMLLTLVSSVAYLCTICSLKHLEVSLVSPMFTLTPAVTAGLASLLIGEHLRQHQLWGIVLLIIGGYILQLEPGQVALYPLQKMKQSKDLHILFAALALYSVGAIIVRHIFVEFGPSPYDVLIVTKIAGALLFATYLLAYRGGLHHVTDQLPRHKGAFFWITSMNMLNSIAIYAALASAFAVQVIAVKRLSAFFSVVVGGRLLHEENLVQKGVASVIMVAGALIVALG